MSRYGKCEMNPEDVAYSSRVAVSTFVLCGELLDYIGPQSVDALVAVRLDYPLSLYLRGSWLYTDESGNTNPWPLILDEPFLPDDVRTWFNDAVLIADGMTELTSQDQLSHVRVDLRVGQVLCLSLDARNSSLLTYRLQKVRRLTPISRGDAAKEIAARC
jgi:hypothetical protein